MLKATVTMLTLHQQPLNTLRNTSRRNRITPTHRFRISSRHSLKHLPSEAQGLAFLELTNSELMLIKKSFFVTVFACLAAFAVGTVCWLILNIAIGAILHSVGVSYVVVPLLLLVFNSVAAFCLFKLAQNSFNYLSFSRLIQTWRRVFG